MCTVHKRINSGFYDGPAAFRSDMRLIWSNAMTYNPPSHFVHGAALEMSRIFEGIKTSKYSKPKTEANLELG